jgi:hydroxymethylpyrimidine/phosphomethylpyrimidine kinase
MRIEALSPSFVVEQVRQVAKGFRVRAVKTGMLYAREIVEGVIGAYDEHLSGVPLVVDPVMVATSGARLLKEDAIEAYGELFRRAAVVTPNLDELAVLTGARPATPAEMEAGGRRLLDRFGAPVLVKGGHLEGPPVDLLVTRAGSERWQSERVSDVHAHGSGCLYASAVAAGLARGLTLLHAVGAAKQWLERAFRAAPAVETTRGTVRVLGDGAGG